MTLGRRVRSSARAVAVGSAAVAALKLLQLVALGRLLSPRDFGVMTMATVAVGLLANVAEIGAGSVVVQRQNLSPTAMNALFWVGLAIGGGAWLALLALSPAIAAHYGEPQLVTVLAIVGTQLLLAAFAMPYRSLLERELDFAVIARVEFIAAGAGVATAIGLASSGAGLLSLPWGVFASSMLSALLFIHAGRRLWRPGLRLARDSFRADIGFGTSLAGQRIVNYVTANADYVLVGTFLGSQTLGLYSVAYTLANLPSSHVNSLINRVSFPALARMQDDLLRMRSAYLRLQRASAFINAPLMLMLAGAAASGLPAVMGDAWTAAVPLLQVLCIVGLTRSIAGTIGPLLLARGRPDLGLRWSLLVLAIQLPCMAAGLHLGGAVGIALGFATAQLVLLVLNYAWLVRTLVGDCLRDYAAASAWPLLFGLLAGLVMAGAGAAARGGVLVVPALAAAGVAAAALYVGTMRLLRPRLLAETVDLIAKRA